MTTAKVGIIGATGYTGLELTRLLLGHPDISLHCLTSNSEAGKPVAAYSSSLRHQTELVYQEHDCKDIFDCNIVFFATPNATAMYKVEELLNQQVRVIDLSADFRLKSHATWEEWYGKPHACKALLEQAVYGLPELYRKEIQSARLVANPGCYPTATILGALPLLEARLLTDNEVIADAKSGHSGAGKTAGTNFCEADNNFNAYAASGHRHMPEIEQILNECYPSEIKLIFVPHLVPMSRGLAVSLYIKSDSPIAALQSLYQQRYQNEVFIDVLPQSSHPETHSVLGTNICRLAVHKQADSNRAIILTVIDNLVKGAAGQAIQNMNIMLGFTETTGLGATAMYP